MEAYIYVGNEKSQDSSDRIFAQCILKGFLILFLYLLLQRGVPSYQILFFTPLSQ